MKLARTFPPMYLQTQNFSPTYIHTHTSTKKTTDLHYMKLNWTDDITQKILPDFDRCFAYIDDAKAQGGICLVHCKKGMSRSGAVVIGYLMYSKQMSLLEALTYARSRRAIIAPNLGFMEQLLEYEMKHQGRITVDLEKYQENRFGDTSILLCGA